MIKDIHKILIGLTLVILFSMFIEACIFKYVDKMNCYKVSNLLLNQVNDLIQTNERNSEELYISVKEDYKIRAQFVSYILDSKKSAIDDIEELKKIAKMLSIDEIHIFDDKGTIISGSVPKYYGLNFDSGEQMSYFKPMLLDKNLSMCQDVTPNTSEGKSMMYAITWNENKDKMIQIGIEPFRLIEAMKQNSIATLFKEMPIYNGTDIFIANVNTKVIIGSNFSDFYKPSLREIGFNIDLDNVSGINNTVVKLNNEKKYCSYMIKDSYLIGVACSTHENNSIFVVTMLVMFFYLLIAGIIISHIFMSRTKLEQKRLSQLKILSSMSRIYYSMHLIDLKNNTVEEFSSTEANKKTHVVLITPETLINSFINNLISEVNQKKFIDFTDIKTLTNRMIGKQMISEDFIGINHNWYKASFISINLNEHNELERVIFVLRNITEEKNKEAFLVHESKTDELTGLLNRRAYEENLKELNADTEFTYISFDLNGLKIANDSIGHEAGDELIKASANFMKLYFGEYGNIFRTGGDEFAAILYKNLSAIPFQFSEFKKQISAWSGNFNHSMSISIGLVLSNERKWNSIQEIVKEADKRMYDDKKIYYQNNGIDRRAYQKTYSSLGNLYTKILKINLTEDSYKIVKVNKDEQTSDKGFENSISAWLKNFAISGQVHKEDLQNYLNKTDLSYMKEYFKKGKRVLSITYKRLIGDIYKTVLMEIVTAEDYSDAAQNCYLYVKDISTSND